VLSEQSQIGSHGPACTKVVIDLGSGRNRQVRSSECTPTPDVAGVTLKGTVLSWSGRGEGRGEERNRGPYPARKVGGGGGGGLGSKKLGGGKELEIKAKPEGKFNTWYRTSCPPGSGEKVSMALG